MNIQKKIGFILVAVIGSIGISCASRNVERTSVDTVTDLSGRWNDTDSRLVSEKMISDMLSKPWSQQFEAEQSRVPAIITGYVKNRSSEHIATTAFIKDIERSIINSGKAIVVASSGERGQIREERLDQQTSASFETIKRLGQETGADFILLGTIISQDDSIDKTTTVTYQVDLELVNIETNQKAWIGSKKIKKIITQRSLRK